MTLYGYMEWIPYFALSAVLTIKKKKGGKDAEYDETRLG